MRRITLAIFAAGMFAAGPASAAVDMFFCATPTLTGETQATGFQGCIDVLSISDAAFVEAGVAELRDIRFVKFVDTSSTTLTRALVTQTHIAKGTFYIRPAGAATTGPASATRSIELFEFTVTSIAGGMSGGEDRATETVSLKPDRIEYMYKASSPNSPASYTCWDLRNRRADPGQC